MDKTVPLILSKKVILIVCLLLGTIIATELALRSPNFTGATSISHAKFLLFDPMHIAAISIIFALLTAIILRLGNRIARIKNKIALTLILLAGFTGMVLGKSEIDILFAGLHSPGFVIWCTLFWITYPIILRFKDGEFSDKNNSGSSIPLEHKPVGWSQPPENDWWSKYN